jgi:hypothetical protein
VLTVEEHAWIGYWGAHMKADEFRLLKEYQKVKFISVNLARQTVNVVFYFMSNNQANSDLTQRGIWRVSEGCGVFLRSSDGNNC